MQHDGISTLWRIAATGEGVTLANGNVAVPYVDGTAQMRKNYIINGDMRDWQRGTNFELTTAAIHSRPLVFTQQQKYSKKR